MKKIISTLLVVVVLFNFIFCGTVEAAPAVNSQSGKEIEESMDAEKSNNTLNGETESGGSVTWAILGSVIQAITEILTRVIMLYPQLIQWLMSIITGVDEFTLEKVVFNKIPIFDVNYFDLNTTESTLSILRESIAEWFYIVRLIAMALNLLVLIYVGIRMALSTISSDKAKYKKMLTSWFESMIILFFMHYILSAIMSLGNLFTDLIAEMYDSFKVAGEQNFEELCMDTIYGAFFEASGWSYVFYGIVFWFLTTIQFRFFCSYFKRLLTVGFLVVISPLVTVTYPIDKIGDGKAQAFTVMMTEFSMNVMIQPIHGLIYLVFMFMAGEIAKTSILISLVFLLFMTKVEKVILHLFDLRNVVSLRPVEEESGIS